MKKMEEENMVTLSALHYDAAIFDLDGVVTQTETLHAKAWKETFDPFLKLHVGEEAFRAFDIHKDYLTYVDGRPRLDGIRTFLSSRGIELSEGSSDDPEDAGTVHALGNKKNRCFHTLLKQGVKLYEPAIELIRKVKNFGLSVAVASSSKNCRAILESVNLTALFDVTVDGVDLQYLGLKGKPEPDLFLEAVKRLGVDPARAIVFEDSVAGVKAAKKGHFGNIIGVDRSAHSEASQPLKAAGADHVVTTLALLNICTETTELPSAFDHFDTIEKQLRDKEVVFYFDYDGTLTPIVSHPQDAHLSESMKTMLMKLSNQCTVAVISGRGLGDIKSRIGIKGIYYAGSHGFEIEGPGIKMEYESALAFIEDLDALEAELKSVLEDVEGAFVERKKFSIALHYRNVSNAELPLIEKAAEESLHRYPKLRKTFGKKVYELQPDLEWNKGRAIEWLGDALMVNNKGSKIVYIGDDITDEDAFSAIQGYGIGILVDGDKARYTSAHYRLENVEAVPRFLEALSLSIERGNIWALAYNGYDPGKEKLREILCALGNGYFVTRAAFPGVKADEVHYPGTYIAGGYNRLKTQIAGKTVKNEDLVNMPDWLVLRFRVGEGDWWSIDETNIIFFRQELDIEEGVLHRLIHVCDVQERETRIIERRLVNMVDKHTAALELTVIPVNWSGVIEVESGINGNIKNEGVQRYRKLANQHLKLIEHREVDEETLLLKMQTVQSELTIAQTVRTRIYRDNEPVSVKAKGIKERAYIGQCYRVEKLESGEHLHIEKNMALFTSRDYAVSNPALEAQLAAEDAKRFEVLLGSHRIAWKQLWEHFDFRLDLQNVAED
ncbi:MAG: trehalose-phosphatase, partial [Sulfurovum sp.]